MTKRPSKLTRRFATLAAQGAYDHEEAALHHGAMTEPAYLTTAQSFTNTQQLLDAADGTDPAAWVYTRRANPTVRLLERTVAALEGSKCSRNSILGNRAHKAFPDLSLSVTGPSSR
ncbi:MAG: PLP-dependent transferase [Actinomycetales bacterium]